MTVAEKKANHAQTVRKSLPEVQKSEGCRMMIMISKVSPRQAAEISSMLLTGVYGKIGNAEVNVDISGER